MTPEEVKKRPVLMRNAQPVRFTAAEAKRSTINSEDCGGQKKTERKPPASFRRLGKVEYEV